MSETGDAAEIPQNIPPFCPMCQRYHAQQSPCAQKLDAWQDGPPQTDQEAWHLARRREVVQIAAGIAQGLVLSLVKVKVAGSDDDADWKPRPFTAPSQSELNEIAAGSFSIAALIFKLGEEAFPRHSR